MQSSQVAIGFRRDPFSRSGELRLGLRLALRSLRQFVACGAVSSILFLLADLVVRMGDHASLNPGHVVGSVGLYTTFAVVFGGALALVVALERLVGKFIFWLGREKLSAMSLLVYPGVAGVLMAPTAFFTFSGSRASRLSNIGPHLMIAAGALVVWGLAFAVRRALAPERQKGAALLSIFMFSSACVLIGVDLTLYVSLYARLHTLLEFSAALLLTLSAVVVVRHWVAGTVVGERALLALSLAGTAWLLAMLTSGSLREVVFKTLEHTWTRPVYVGRMLARLQGAQRGFQQPAGKATLLHEVMARHDLALSGLNPKWKSTAREKASLPATSPDRLQDMNVVVFYVDTLRADVAKDPRTMPVARAFADRNLDFTRAYAAGSDTLRSLPVLISGRYDHDQGGRDLLTQAKAAKLKRGLFIARSAQRFLAKELPRFRFDESVVVQDYDPKRKVWGYGADRSTARELVDQCLHWIDAQQDRRFFAWLFNFDQHNWRELEKAWVHKTAERLRVPDKAPLNWRYRVVASAVDEQFGRLLAGLKARKLEDKTIVVFVSDHGEALGRDGFWVHSIFLWEVLVRVPLTLRIPGLGAKRVDQPVSLVDLAPTLAPFLGGGTQLGHYHGEDLLVYASRTPQVRKRPILMRAASHKKILRLGIVDRQRPWKLVLPLEAGVPELYNTQSRDPDRQNLAEQHSKAHLELLSELSQSPIFQEALEKSGPK